jgi:ABC-type nitrate/sulfonate/bicarbonate transport system substrate-binding protein
MHNRREFLTRSAWFAGGAAALAACGSSAASPATTAAPGTTAAATTTTAGTATTAAATTVAGATTTATDAPKVAAVNGLVRTQFNWIADIEWAAWYLADAKGFFAAKGAKVALLHGGPNTPAVPQVLAAGSADLGVASDELQLIQANAQGSDYVVLGAMYQRSPFGYCWLADTPITTAKDLQGKKIGGVQGDQIRIEAVFKVNGLDPKNYTFVPMDFDPQPLVDKEVDVITAYVTNQPIQLQLKGVATKSAPFSDFGLKSYGDVLFASKKYIDANRPLLVEYLAGLLAGVQENVKDPTAVLPLLSSTYGKDVDIDLNYAKAGNPAYIALYESDFTKQHGLLSVDPAYLDQQVLPGYATAGETKLPTAATFADTTILADAAKG